MSEELESCPICGALPADQVDHGAVRELASNRYKFNRQELLDSCASTTPEGHGGGEDAREAAKRIVDWDDNGRLADDEWLVERNETAIIAICRALLSSPRVEEVRREALEEAAKVAERGCLTHPDGGSPTEPERELCEAIAADIRAL